MGSPGRRRQGAEPGRSNNRRTAVGITKLGSTRRFAQAGPGHVGSACRRTACCIARVGFARRAGRCSSRAHLGFAPSPGCFGRCLAGTTSDVGITVAAIGAVGAGAKLGRASARLVAAARCRTACTSSVVGRSCRAGTGMGPTAGSARRARRARRTGFAGGAGMGTTARAVGKCTPSASSRGACTVMGRPSRSLQGCRAIGAVLESARPGLGSAQAGGIHAAGAGHQRLGRTASCGSGATADRRPVVERAGRARLGRAEDRRACSSRRAVMVGAGLAAG